jgi:hypothetical protein
MTSLIGIFEENVMTKYTVELEDDYAVVKENGNELFRYEDPRGYEDLACVSFLIKLLNDKETELLTYTQTNI